ncbi:MAG: hypothetical protein P8129_23550 [Anaerolineae bacterium]
MLPQSGGEAIRARKERRSEAAIGALARARSLWQVEAALGLLILVGLILLMRDWGIDDPYITFRYARNLLEGQGFVYNVGQRTLSTTAPLYALLLALLGHLWKDLPALSNVLSAISLVSSAALLLLLSDSRGRRVPGMIAALLLSLSPYLAWTFGAETCFSIMLILGGFYAYERSHYGLTGGLLALATMARPDAVLAAAAVALVHLARRRPIPWRAALLYAALLAAWFLGLWLYFGSPLPVTLMVKQQQGQMSISTRFWGGLLDLIRGYGRDPVYWLHAALALLGLAEVVRHARHWLPLLLWTALYIAAYSLLGVSKYFWYYAPLLPAFVVLVAEGTAALLRALKRRGLPRLATVGLSGLLVIVLLAPLVAGLLSGSWNPDPRLGVYREIGQWLEANTPPGASVGMLEVGIIGYYARRPVVDFAGLIQPDVARRFTASTTYQESATWTIRTYEPDYVLLHRGPFSELANSDWFLAAYTPRHEFANQQQLWMTLYERRRMDLGQSEAP